MRAAARRRPSGGGRRVCELCNTRVITAGRGCIAKRRRNRAISDRLVRAAACCVVDVGQMHRGFNSSACAHARRCSIVLVEKHARLRDARLAER